MVLHSPKAFGEFRTNEVGIKEYPPVRRTRDSDEAAVTFRRGWVIEVSIKRTMAQSDSSSVRRYDYPRPL